MSMFIGLPELARNPYVCLPGDEDISCAIPKLEIIGLRIHDEFGCAEAMRTKEV